MSFVEAMKLKNKLPRRIVQIILLSMAVIYYISLAIMHHISPLTSMLPDLIVLFATLLILAMAAIHLIPRINWLIVIGMVSLPGVIFSFLMHNFLEGLASRTESIFILNQLLVFLHSAFFVAGIFVFPPLILIGIIGGIIVLYMEFNRRRPQSPLTG